MMVRNLYYWLRPELRLLVRRAYYLPADLWANLKGNPGSLAPPRGMIFIGGGDFRRIGALYLKRFIELGGLKPAHRVLDIGCGIGRIAVPLTGYLSPEGSYEGFDVVEKGIKWCNKKITPSYPNFRFRFVNLKNSLYNSEQENLARDFSFPYPDREFDFVFLTSVFTHMEPADMEHYLSEIHRVLKPGGLCYATWFILNEASLTAMARHDGLQFTHNHGYYRTLSKQVAEANVAYDEQYLTDRCLTPRGFIIEQLRYGYWSGRNREETLDFQDTLILKKRQD